MSASSSSSGKVDPYGIASAVIGTVASVIIAKNTQKGEIRKNEALEKELNSLDERSVMELAERIKSVTNELQRERVLVEFLSEQKGKALLAKANKKKYIAFATVGIGFVVFALLYYIKMNKDGQGK